MLVCVTLIYQFIIIRFTQYRHKYCSRILTVQAHISRRCVYLHIMWLSWYIQSHIVCSSKFLRTTFPGKLLYGKRLSGKVIVRETSVNRSNCVARLRRCRCQHCYRYWLDNLLNHPMLLLTLWDWDMYTTFDEIASIFRVNFNYILPLFDTIWAKVWTNERSSYEERAEEDEGDEVRNRNTHSARVRSATTRLRVAWFAVHARQHDLLPALPRSAPVAKPIISTW